MLASAEPGRSLSVLILTLNEGPNVERLLQGLHRALRRVDDYEIVVVDGGSTDDTVEVAKRNGARVVTQRERGYGNAFREGVAACHGDFVVTLDADLSHDPRVAADLHAARQQADLLIASRYVPFGHANMPEGRRILSRILNFVYTALLDLPVRDISSGFRLYRRRVFDEIRLQGRDFDVLPEALIKAYALGYRVHEVPFHYWPRNAGRSHAQLFRFGMSYLRTLWRAFKLRNSAASADHDYRAFHSRNPLTRHWLRRRYAVVTRMAGEYERGIDVGCGSSILLEALPNVVGVDAAQAPLRFLSGHSSRDLVRAAANALPFATGAFDLGIASRLLERLDDPQAALQELARVIRPGGRLVISTPDAEHPFWVATGWLTSWLAPAAHGPAARLGARSLADLVRRAGFEPEAAAHVGGGELVLQARRRP